MPGVLSGLSIPNKQLVIPVHSEAGEPLLLASRIIKNVNASSYIFRDIPSSFILATSNHSNS